MNKRTYHYFSKVPAIPCPSGSATKDKNMLVQKGNNYSLKKIGVIDTQEQIQTHLDGVSLARMIARFKRGDADALHVRSGFYGDVSGFSDNPAEVINNTRALPNNLLIQEEAQEPTQEKAPAVETTPQEVSNA